MTAFDTGRPKNSSASRLQLGEDERGDLRDRARRARRAARGRRALGAGDERVRQHARARPRPRCEPQRRPMSRFAAKTVFSAFVIACRFATWPTSRLPFLATATTDGVRG